VPLFGSEARLVVGLLSPGPGRGSHRSRRLGNGLGRSAPGGGCRGRRSGRRRRLRRGSSPSARRGLGTFRRRLRRLGRGFRSWRRRNLRWVRLVMGRCRLCRGRLALEDPFQSGEASAAGHRSAGGGLDGDPVERSGRERRHRLPALGTARELADAVLTERRPARVGDGGDATASHAAGRRRRAGGRRTHGSRSGDVVNARAPFARGRGDNDRLDAPRKLRRSRGTGDLLRALRFRLHGLARTELRRIRAEVEGGERRVDGGPRLLYDLDQPSLVDAHAQRANDLEQRALLRREDEGLSSELLHIRRQFEVLRAQVGFEDRP